MYNHFLIKFFLLIFTIIAFFTPENLAKESEILANFRQAEQQSWLDYINEMMDILHQTIIDQKNYIIALEVLLETSYDLMTDSCYEFTDEELADIKMTHLQMVEELLETGDIKRY